ncbi:putative methyltransferase-domain-containing protein, partial [Tribonema minus]
MPRQLVLAVAAASCLPVRALQCVPGHAGFQTQYYNHGGRHEAQARSAIDGEEATAALSHLNLSRQERTLARKSRSYRRRQGKLTAAQRRAMRELWPVYGLDILPNEKWDWRHTFQSHTRAAPPRVILDIGFGKGDSILAMARAAPDLCFCGIEVHKPGIGAALQRLGAGIVERRDDLLQADAQALQLDSTTPILCLDDLPPVVTAEVHSAEADVGAIRVLGGGVEQDAVRRRAVKNVRLIYGDAIMVLADSIPEHSLSEVCIFYPDPFPDDPNRRIVRPLVVELLASRLQNGGKLHIATDVEAYAAHIQTVMTSADSKMLGWHGGQLSARPHWRPHTMYERIAFEEGRSTW